MPGTITDGRFLQDPSVTTLIQAALTGAALLPANNLSDVASAATSRTNLGLGTAATLAATAVAQTANNLSDLASAPTARTNLGLGTAATQASTAFAPSTNVPTAKSANYTMVAADSLVLVTAGAGGVTITLPASPNNGQRYSVKKVDSAAGAVTVAGSSGNIDGAANVTFTAQYTSRDFMYDGTNWWQV